MKTKFYYFLVMICVALVWASCNRELEYEHMGEAANPEYGYVFHPKDTLKPGETLIRYDSIYVIKYEYVHDTVHDTIIKVVTDTTTGEVVERYKIASDIVKYGNGFGDNQLSEYFKDDELRLAEREMRTAVVSNDVDTIFADNVDNLTWTAYRPSSNPVEYDVRGEYDVNKYSRVQKFALSNGVDYNVSGSEESLSADCDGEKVDMLYRKQVSYDLLNVTATPTTDTLVKGNDIYVEYILESEFEAEYELRPFGKASDDADVVVVDTFTISSAAASKDNGIATFFVKVGEVPEDTVPVIPIDTVTPTPTDTVTPTPTDTVTPTPTDTVITTPDDGYTINNEKIDSIHFSYTPNPATKGLSEVLVIHYPHYVVLVVAKQILLPAFSVTNHDDYNSAVWYNNAWAPAYLNLERGFEWQIGGVDGTPVCSETDKVVDDQLTKLGIHSMSRSDFLKPATFVNEGKTTRVCVGGKYYMTLK